MCSVGRSGIVNVRPVGHNAGPRISSRTRMAAVLRPIVRATWHQLIIDSTRSPKGPGRGGYRSGAKVVALTYASSSTTRSTRSSPAGPTPTFPDVGECRVAWVRSVSPVVLRTDQRSRAESQHLRLVPDSRPGDIDSNRAQRVGEARRPSGGTSVDRITPRRAADLMLTNPVGTFSHVGLTGRTSYFRSAGGSRRSERARYLMQ